MNLNKLLLVCCFALDGICKVNALGMDVSNYWSLNDKSNTPNNKEQIELETQLIDDVCGQWIEARRMHYAGKKKDEGGWVNGCMHNGQYESWDKSLKNIGTLISIALNDKQIVFDRVNWDTNPNAEALRNGMWMQKFIQMVIKEIKNNKNKDLEELKKEVLKKFYEDEELNKYARTLHDMHSYIDTLDVFKMITTTVCTSMLIKQMPKYEQELNKKNNFRVEPIEQNNGCNNCYEASLFQIVNALDPKQIDDEGLKKFRELVDNYREQYASKEKDKLTEKKELLNPQVAFDKEFNRVWMSRGGELEQLIRSIKGRDNRLLVLSLIYNAYEEMIYPSKNKSPFKKEIDLIFRNKGSKKQKTFLKNNINTIKMTGVEKDKLDSIKEEAVDKEEEPNDENNEQNIEKPIQGEENTGNNNKKTDAASTLNQQSTSENDRSNGNIERKIKKNQTFLSGNKQGNKKNNKTDANLLYLAINRYLKSNEKKQTITDLLKNYGINNEKVIPELKDKIKSMLWSKYGRDSAVAELQAGISYFLQELVAPYSNTSFTAKILNDEQKILAAKIITIYKIYTLVKSRKTSEIGHLFNRVAGYYNIYQGKFTDYIDGWYRTDLQDEWTQISEKDFGTLTIGSIADYESNNIGDSISNAFNVLARNRYAETCRSKISINKCVRVSALIDKIFSSNIPYYQAFPAMCGQKQLDVNSLDVIKRDIAEIYTNSINSKIDKDEIIREKVLERLSDIISKVRVSISFTGKKYEYKINGKTLFENLSEFDVSDRIVSELSENGFTTKNIDNINNELENRYVTTRIKKYPKVFIKMTEDYRKEVVAKTEKLLANHDYLPVITPEGKILIYRLRGFANYTDGKQGKHYNASIYTGSEWCTVDSYYEKNNFNGKNDRRDYYPVFYMYQLIYEG